MPTGTILLLSANPMHDTGGGQRSAQQALELLDRGWRVVFAAHGEVTESVDLGLVYDRPGLVHCGESEARAALGLGWRRGIAQLGLPPETPHGRAVALAQLPLPGWPRLLRRLAREGVVTVYDCVDRWEGPLGYGWYRRDVETKLSRTVALRTASAPALTRHLSEISRRPAHLLPNAVNPALFDPRTARDRPSELPAADEGRPIVYYHGALWGHWMDWELIRAVATARPEVDFVFVGDHQGEGEGLPANCHFPGLRPQSALPAFLAHVDVTWLPWSVDEVTRATSPLKVFEYRAMGLPVVGPEIEPLDGIDGVVRTRGVEGFGAALDAALAHPASVEERRRAGDRVRASEGWGARIDLLERWIGEADSAGRARRGFWPFGPGPFGLRE